ncbi:hypothetical protein L6164_010864 [Bauhinia variegata]|uniref:Uncharacterized protein n=1 Tax=Bauhinia variegata TaxID=167791 RepID=A0ACB9P405_BAUVA|nr:hypothetical protein L6164_010864 [Bauhinia variegata]
MIDSDFSSSANDSTNNHTNAHKRSFVDAPSAEPSRDSSSKKSRTSLGNQVGIVVELKHFEVPLVSAIDGSCSGCESIHLRVDQPYTIGRSARHCEFVFHERRVSKQHCQILFDGSRQKLYILDGVLSVNDSTRFIVRQFRNRLMTFHGNDIEVPKGVRFQASSNGVFVNGVKIRKGMAVELSDGNKVLLVCGHENGSCNIQNRVGFVIRRIVSVGNGFGRRDNDAIEGMHKLDAMTFSRHSQGLPLIRKRNKRVFATRENGLYRSSASFKTKYEGLIGRASFLLDWCREILLSDDPVPCILDAISDIGCKYTLATSLNNFSGTNSGNAVRLLVNSEEQSQYIKTVLGLELPLQANLSVDMQMDNKSTGIVRSTSAKLDGTEIMSLVANSYHHQHLCQEGNVEVAPENDIFVKNPNSNFSNSVCKDNHPLGGNEQEKHVGIFYSSPGKNFFLNRLEFANYGSSVLDNAISLPELLYPVQSITRMFIATFTSEIKWFLSYCKIPCHLAVTIACHNTERCWSSRTHERIDVPYPDYPNLVVVYPPFPETIAFSNNRKKRGIACHHPKLLVFQREDSIRVVITSANLVEKQWNNVTNTIWWQDFPRVSSADYASLFPKNLDGDMNLDSECDFAAHLSGFMASLLIDMPDQAHWIVDLTKYDFRGATGHLIASVPGIHCYRSFAMSESLNSSTFLGSVAASVVGLSHLFHAAADSNGTRLKRLATFLGKSCGAHGRLEIVLRRNPDVPTDSNAVSILVPSPNGTSEGDYVQLGFLPRNVAKWVSPLWDVGFFKFSGYVCPKEALAAALGENCKKVQLVLYVSRGQHFQDISKMMQPEHMVAICSLIASTQRCYGVWRLQEVLNRYKWPETLQSDIIYSSSSIGSSVNPQFLAAFSAAVGMKSLQCFDSEESDPEWGYWNANEELKNPSIKIVFPTVERVKNAYNGILPSRRILCFSERTWQRLKSLDILHDAIPHPRDRVGLPMHVKVVRRRFSSGRDARSTGWVYCGSHNFSAAAWGRQISNPYGKKADGPRKGSACLDSGLHICNYEIGIVFTFPPTENNDSPRVKSTNLDDIVLPFVVPAPKYGSRDKPATMQAMREAMAELNEQQSEKHAEEEMVEKILEEEEEMETINYAAEEQEEEKAYAEMLWSQVDSSLSC